MPKRKKTTQTISLIVSLSNAAEHVSSLASEIILTLERTARPFELIFVDDASSDSTFERLSDTARADKRIRAIRMRSAFGEGAALQAGLANSVGEVVVFVSDRVHLNPNDLVKLLAPLEDEFDLAVAWRWPRRDSILNRQVSRLFNRAASRLSNVRLHDINSGCFAARRSLLQKVTLYGDLYDFLPILAAQQGYRVTEVQVEQLPGVFRVSRYPNEYVKRSLDMLTVFFLTRYSKKPIHFMGFVGTLLLVAGVAIELYLFVYRILGFGGIAGRPLLILGALALIIGIQMISIGLLGEMIIFTHAADIEEYNIEEIIQREP
jgi:glycosyltransferase involved in cell wall biosynthesis